MAKVTHHSSTRLPSLSIAIYLPRPSLLGDGRSEMVSGAGSNDPSLGITWHGR